MKLELDLTQSQILSPQMQLSVRILQMNSQDLYTFVDNMTLENPTLDIADPPGESIDEQRWLNSVNDEDHYLHQRQNNDDEYIDGREHIFTTDQGETLRDFLWSQLVSRRFTADEADILTFILESLDEQGYLRENPEDIASFLNADVSKVEAMIREVQSLEPSGVAALDLNECLKLQLKRLKLLTPVMERLIDEHLGLIAGNALTVIASRMQMPLEEIVKCCELIRSLNPKPGNAFYSHEQINYIIPDVSVSCFHDHFDILINDYASPRILVNPDYREMSIRTEDEEVRKYLQSKIRQTEWIRQCISLRSRTLLNVSREILMRQGDFFLYGPGHIRPLKMSDVAEAVGVHESTVSRTVSNKFLQCSWGVYPMNSFFPRRVQVRSAGNDLSEDNAALTGSDIKKVLHAIIDREDKSTPYSDSSLCELLGEKGIRISRRTVAKYRMEENIPNKAGRKDYSGSSQ